MLSIATTTATATATVAALSAVAAVAAESAPQTLRVKRVVATATATATASAPTAVIAGALIDKDKRHEVFGQVAGGAGSRGPEVKQRGWITEGTGVACGTSQMRINKRTLVMEDCVAPMKKVDGFEWTENFDGVQNAGTKKIYINLKCVVGAGGSQTRTLRDECYPFVEAQLNYLLKSRSAGVFFANIFDGDEAAKRMPMFEYLLGLPEYADITGQVYVGDLLGYYERFNLWGAV